VDYKEIDWKNGKFDSKQLLAKFASTKRMKHNFDQWKIHHQTRTLAFCVSKIHADNMAECFIKQGIRAAAVYTGSKVL
jgi:superfamily II DNA or RNA helicase